MIHYSKVKLGKNPARHDPRTLQMAQYLQVGALPKIPESQSWIGKVRNWPMMGNDKIGDCTCAAAGHLIEEWTACSRDKAVILSNTQIIAAYSAITGYNPKTGQHDNGAVELDVLKYWRATGFSGHKILSFVALEPKNLDHIRASVFIFGGCYIGLQLPTSAQTQSVWGVPPGGANGPGAPGSWGGHAVPVVAYDPQGLTVVTWGALKRMTWGFWNAYCDEAYAIVSNDWVNTKDVASNGFDLKQMNQDLKSITH
jgi:hypothetical protein